MAHKLDQIRRDGNRTRVAAPSPDAPQPEKLQAAMRHVGPWKCALCPFEVAYDPDWGKMSAQILAHGERIHELTKSADAMVDTAQPEEIGLGVVNCPAYSIPQFADACIHSVPTNGCPACERRYPFKDAGEPARAGQPSNEIPFTAYDWIQLALGQPDRTAVALRKALELLDAPQAAVLQKAQSCVVKNRRTEKGREFWDHVESIAAQERAQADVPESQDELPDYDAEYYEIRARMAPFNGNLEMVAPMLQCRERQLIATRAELRNLEQELRYHLWLSHGHPGIYGDDGEMQCSECAKFGCWDYKNSPLNEVRKAYRGACLERAAQAQIANLTKEA